MAESYLRSSNREPIPAAVDRIAAEVVDAAYVVHRHFGPGLYENVYEVCLAHELVKRGLRVERQVPQPVCYDDVQLDLGFRFDQIVEEAVVVETKTVPHILPIHRAQVLTYLKLSKYRLGLLINFNEILIKDGIRRFVVE